MGTKESLDKIEKYLQPILEGFDLELFDIEYVKEGPNYFLRIYIDKETGVLIEDCEKTSRALDEFLEQYDPFPESYILEVSSPGIDRPLKTAEDYEYYKGEMVDIKLYKAFEKQKEFQGELVGMIDDEVNIIVEDRVLKFKKSEVAVCKLAIIL